ncbi:MAG: hypothetical protein BGO21_28680 [Dyadobacter sp. 50-39]|uniref:type II toxin-antitoxin system VapC family toxin n=1 Tax=Dyadobacter sp. 50-39 TaxID=1895756 RepID=UPI00095DC491|nr:type II toxin-antitoxin system VapC family toxin [Dyadobacter sp. 50-39]OJV16835.1 MAG: hypothetical protein BGO21_28680 [Dyadobacter sp. 50-39]
MAQKLVLVDTSILIDFFRKSDKSNSRLLKLVREGFVLLKKQSKLIGMADIFIAATAVHYGLPLATLNVKHFERIEELQILP